MTVLHELKVYEQMRLTIVIISVFGAILCIGSIWTLTRSSKSSRGSTWLTIYIVLGCMQGYVFTATYAIPPSFETCVARTGILLLGYSTFLANLVCKHALVANIASKRARIKNPQKIVLLYRVVCGLAVFFEMVLFISYARVSDISVHQIETEAYYFQACTTDHASNIQHILTAYNIILFTALLVTAFMHTWLLTCTELNESGSLTLTSIIIALTYLLSASLSVPGDPYSEYKISLCVHIGVTLAFCVAVGKSVVAAAAVMLYSQVSRQVLSSQVKTNTVSVDVVVGDSSKQESKSKSEVGLLLAKRTVWASKMGPSTIVYKTFSKSPILLLSPKWIEAVCELNKLESRMWLSFTSAETVDTFVLNERDLFIQGSLIHLERFGVVEFATEMDAVAFLVELKEKKRGDICSQRNCKEKIGKLEKKDLLISGGT
ncbi:hypothetical protein BDR26DRAFT_506567 [Obelidium mucronatum]|nr:hypothetical protein BDR26DRAFT_506567 [Obelidium mucronatum]